MSVADGRWAWLSRGMATYDDMQEFNPGIEGMDKESLKKEMSACELNAENSETWTSSIEEVFMQPDVQRTTFLWQIDLKSEAEVAWEDEEEDQELNWRCLPAHWQAILNSRLAEFNSKIQDAEAFYLHRKGEFGEGDVKTKNALKKWESLKEGEGASSVILIAKGTGKEASPEVYHRAVSRSKGVVKVQCGPKITAYKLNVKEMNLECMDSTSTEEDGKVQHDAVRKLRIISVTGRSRELQEVRIHLTALSLATSDVLQSSGLQPSKGAACNLDIDNMGQTGDDHETKSEEQQPGHTRMCFVHAKPTVSRNRFCQLAPLNIHATYYTQNIEQKYIYVKREREDRWRDTVNNNNNI